MSWYVKPKFIIFPVFVIHNSKLLYVTEERSVMSELDRSYTTLIRTFVQQQYYVVVIITKVMILMIQHCTIYHLQSEKVSHDLN